MIVRRADCGHYISVDIAPAGIHEGNEQPVYLCGPCADRARGGFETKVIRPVALENVSNPADLRSDLSPYAAGAVAARSGATEEDCPILDRRTKEAREWLRGFREADSDGKRTGGT